MYGFWLPNDPRGSWSDFVRKWEIARFGKPLKSTDRRSLGQLSEQELAARQAALANLTYEPVSISGSQALTIAGAFAALASKSSYTIWACAILPEHTHIVLARHRYKVEITANLLKGASTSAMIEAGNHPLAHHAKDGARPPRMWAAHQWKHYLDSEEDIEQAIQYVVDNPLREGKRIQSWSFVSKFAGLTKGGWLTYY
jgi:REP element-mobilizing transposase RayT